MYLFFFLLIRHERSNGCALLHLNYSSWINISFMSCHVIRLDFKKIHSENQGLCELKTEIEAKKSQQPSVKKADVETTVVSKVIEKAQNVHVQHIEGVKTYFYYFLSLTPSLINCLFVLLLLCLFL